MPHEGRILIVEDEKEWIEKYRRVLSSRSYLKMHAAMTLMQAQGYLRQNVYDLIILDLRLDDRDEENFSGKELLIDLEMITEEQGTQVIIISGYATIPITREAFKRYGVYNVMDKSELPDHLDEFIQDVADGIDMAYSRREEIAQGKYG